VLPPSKPDLIRISGTVSELYECGVGIELADGEFEYIYEDVYAMSVEDAKRKAEKLNPSTNGRTLLYVVAWLKYDPAATVH